ncbi:hypothetical protein EIP86_000589 [Pleurotus ostreatoroseus]|nr:hypothetical protein EIP86_000589 [Pleurotus ostreatoroseus]
MLAYSSAVPAGVNAEEELAQVVGDVAASIAAFGGWGGKRSVWLCALDAQFAKGICLVRRALNAHARINQLPEDVLRAIFQWLCPPSFGVFLPDAFGNERMASATTHQQALRRWVRLTSVCRLWRDVALSSPTMWNTIAVGPDATPNAAVEMQLRYSARAPIDFHVWFTERQSTQCGPFDWTRLDLQAIIPRLRSLHIHPAQYLCLLRIFNRITIPAPALEHLTLTPECLPFFGVEGELPVAPTMPTVFQDDMPRLKSLTIAYFTQWPGNNFRNLTRLCLMHQKTYRWSWDATFLFQFLNASPDLEELVFFYTAALTDDRHPNDPTALLRPSLPRLKTLVMTGWESSSSALFLSCLDLSPSCAVVINAVDGGQPSIPDDSMHLSLYLRSMTRLNLCTDYEHASPLHVLACGQSGLYYKTDYWPGFSVVAQSVIAPAWTEHASMHSIPITPTLLRMYSTMNLEELRIEIHAWINADILQWKELYASMAGVKKLVIVALGKWGEPGTQCLEALALAEDGHFCLPYLAELHVVHTSQPADSWLAILRDVVKDRSRRGPAIHKVVVGIEPSLEVPASYRSWTEDDPCVQVMRTDEAEPFNLSPFDQRGRVYSSRYWPSELRDGSSSLCSSKRTL